MPTSREFMNDMSVCVADPVKPPLGISGPALVIQSKSVRGIELPPDVSVVDEFTCSVAVRVLATAERDRAQTITLFAAHAGKLAPIAAPEAALVTPAIGG